jgi:hypothetical protein
MELSMYSLQYCKFALFLTVDETETERVRNLDVR